MVRLDPVPADDDDPTLSRVFDVFRSKGQDVPMLYRLLGNSPAMLDAWIGLAWPLRTEPTTTRALRELLIMRVATLTHASFEWQAHWPAAIGAGVHAEQLAALGDWPASELFSAAEKAALRCTDEMIERGGASAEAVSKLRDHFADGECVELILTAAFYSCVSHTLLTLGVDATGPDVDADEPDHPLAVYRALTS